MYFFIWWLFCIFGQGPYHSSLWFLALMAGCVSSGTSLLGISLSVQHKCNCGAWSQSKDPCWHHASQRQGFWKGSWLIWCFHANLLFLGRSWGIDRGLSGNVPGAHPFLTFIFFPNQLFSCKDMWNGEGGRAHPWFFCIFFLKVPPHPVVKVHPVSLPVLIVLAVNTGCLCIFPAHYQQTALIMQIHPSHCALRSAQTIDQAIKHN